MFPNTGADIIIKGLNHLQHFDLSVHDLHPPPAAERFTADGSSVALVLGSLNAQIALGSKTSTWIDVCEDRSISLLSCQDYKKLAIISKEFIKPNVKVIHTNNVNATGVTHSSTQNLVDNPTPNV